MSIGRGTTPTHTFRPKQPVDLSSASVLFITYKQNGHTRVEKSKEDLEELTAEKIVVKLTQRDTLAFDDHTDTEIQIRAKFEDGTALASKVKVVPIDKVLKEGTI